MTFDEVLVQVQALLQQEKRVSYRGLKRRFALDDEYIEDLKEELIGAKQIATDEEGRFLVWVGEAEKRTAKSVERTETTGQEVNVAPRFTLHAPRPDGERRQLTVMFCDLVGSTALSEQLDPEELREVVRAYQEKCTEVIRRYDGYIAQHLGDGLLTYFGYPLAHEDDATRAVQAGLEIIAAIQEKVSSLFQDTVGEILPIPPLEKEGTQKPPLEKRAARSAGGFGSVEGGRKLQVRIGIHTGLVVVGEIGSNERREVLALGETPNIAARLQSLAEPDTVVLSAVTQRLVVGLFECRDLGPQTLKGISSPLSVYQVVGASQAQSRFDVEVRKGLTPLVGREEELGLLRRRWEQAKGGAGQVVFLSGEPGIGKSRLVQTLAEYVLTDGATRIEFRCSAYHQNSAFYPILEHLQRLLSFALDDTPQAKLAKLQQILAHYHFPQADTFSLLAALLSLPHPDGVPPLTLSPQKQKQKTQEALVAWIIEEAEKTAVYCAWEDLHWADPSTLEVLTLFLDQVPTARLLATLTFRSEFTPPWKSRSHISHLTLSRLGQPQVEAMVEQVTGDNLLPKEIVQQIVSKTDGVPLFVEELTKTVVEQNVGAYCNTPLLGIPATLQDALMARLDRLGTAKEIAKMGAVLGREFSYELLHAVSAVAEETLQQGLKQLVEAELVYQRGIPPRATYFFKHALIQDTAYQSLLKSKRQQYHQQIAKTLEEQFPLTVKTQPEFVAHHYTEAGFIVQAIPYWRRAGRRAMERSANVEAIGHFTKGLELLRTLPDTIERVQQELTLQIALGGPLMATKGYASPEVEEAYSRARELCRQVGETPKLFPVLAGLWVFYEHRTEYKTMHELAEQYLRMAQRVQDPSFLVWGHYLMGETLRFLGDSALARVHLEQGIALYDPQQHRALALRTGFDPGTPTLCEVAWALWFLGYPAQALKRIHGALTLAHEVSHPFNLATALANAAMFHQYRREGETAKERAEATIALASEQGFPHWLAIGTFVQGWVLAEQGQQEKGAAQMRQGLATYRTTSELYRPHLLGLLAEVYGKGGQVEEGLNVLAEALATVDKTGERYYEAELYRLRGELTLAQSSVQGLESSVQANQKSKGKSQKSENPNPKSQIPDPESEAEACFLKAVDIAQRQQAKSLELRATTSLARLWQSQGKHHAAHNMLSNIYKWFTEGLDTKDLQEAKTLLDELQP